MKISILVPTRKRPQQMRRLVESALYLAYDSDNIEVIFYIDTDDEGSINMAKELEKKYPNSIKFIVGGRIVLSQMWNECWKIATGEIYHHCGDDIVFRTLNWDKIVVEEFSKVPDRILFLYGRDGVWDDERLGTHGFLHKNWTDTVGYFVPPYFSFCWNDTWLTDVSTKIGRKKFITTIYTEHMHHCRGKSEHDTTYKEAQARGRVDKVGSIYTSKEPERVADAEKLLAFIQRFKEDK